MQSSHIPTAGLTLNRDRLLAKMEQTDRQLTIITGPPGYGKTRLAAQFAAQQNSPVAWLTLNRRDRDITWLHEHTLASLTGVRPSATVTDPAEIAVDMVDALVTLGKQGITWIIDDVHVLDGIAEAEQWLLQLIDILPTQVRLILIARTMPPLDYSSLIAKGQVAAIGPTDLRFTVEEGVALAHLLGGKGSAELAEVRTIVERFDGWPAGVALSMQVRAKNFPASLSTPDMSALFNKLAAGMLASQPRARREFLLRAATMPYMTVAGLRACFGIEDGAQQLGDLQKHNLFVMHSANGLVFHALFRKFLQETFSARQPDAFREAHKQVAAWLVDEAKPVQAIEHLLAASDAPQAVHLIERLAASLEAQENFNTLLSWLDALERLEEHTPVLDLVCARIHSKRYNYAEMERLLQRAEAGFDAVGSSLARRRVDLLRATSLLQQGHVERATPLLEELADTLPHTNNLRGKALAKCGLAYLLQGRLEEAKYTLGYARSLFRDTDDPRDLGYVLQDLHIVHLKLGDYATAGEVLHEYVGIKRSSGGTRAQADALNSLGYYYHQMGNYQQADEAFSEGLRLAMRVSARRIEAYLNWSKGDLLRDLGAFAQAVIHYEHSLQATDSPEPLLRMSVLLNFSTLRRWQGNQLEAVRLAAEAYELASENNIEIEKCVAQALRISALADETNAGKYLSAMRGVVSTLRELHAQEETARTDALLARLELLAGNPEQAHRVLAAHIPPDGATVHLQPLAAEILHMPLLEQFVLESPRYAPLHRWIKRLEEANLRETSTSRGYSFPTRLPYEIRVTTLKDISIEVDGQTIERSDWQAVAARDLFLYLVFNGPSTREKISLAFWPDKAPDRVRASFHTTLYRMRSALSDDIAPFREGYYELNPHVRIECDAIRMREAVDLARKLSVNDARCENEWRRAENIYKGEFLPGLDGEWVEVLRQELEAAHLESVISLGRCARARKALNLAENWFQKALRVEPLLEEVHRDLIKTYAMMGEKGRIAQQMQILTTLLDEAFGITPSNETQRLAALLLA